MTKDEIDDISRSIAVLEELLKEAKTSRDLANDAMNDAGLATYSNYWQKCRQHQDANHERAVALKLAIKALQEKLV